MPVAGFPAFAKASAGNAGLFDSIRKDEREGAHKNTIFDDAYCLDL